MERLAAVSFVDAPLSFFECFDSREHEFNADQFGLFEPDIQPFLAPLL